MTQASAPSYTVEQITQQFQALLPTGSVWPRDSEAVMTQVFSALMNTPQRLTADSATINGDTVGGAAGLIQDAFPVAPVYLLPEWEATLGLPDPCAGPEPTLTLRQQAVAARFVATGGQSVPYMVNIAAQYGYTITITEFGPPYHFGQTFGKPITGTLWAFAWQVNIEKASPTVYFPFGDATNGLFGDPFASGNGDPVLRCELQRVSPAHTTLFFVYVGVTLNPTSISSTLRMGSPAL
jgi:uncharacterized protein YmfQ (DUF2313 family)